MSGTKYPYLIFDVDDTLMDFGASFGAAMEKTIRYGGGSCDEKLLELLAQYSWELWQEVGLNNTENPFVRKHYHKLYGEYLEKLYGKLAAEMGLCHSGRELRDAYLGYLARESPLLPDAERAIRRLSANHHVIIATNGLTGVQTQRLALLSPYLDRLYISEQVGSIKPDTEFFHAMLHDLGLHDARACLMVGDSVNNDVRGALAVGMDACWLNPKKKPAPADLRIPYEIENLSQLLKLRI